MHEIPLIFYIAALLLVACTMLLSSQDEEGWEWLEEDQNLHQYHLPAEVSSYLTCTIDVCVPYSQCVHNEAPYSYWIDL